MRRILFPLEGGTSSFTLSPGVVYPLLLQNTANSLENNRFSELVSSRWALEILHGMESASGVSRPLAKAALERLAARLAAESGSGGLRNAFALLAGEDQAALRQRFGASLQELLSL